MDSVERQTNVLAQPNVAAAVGVFVDGFDAANQRLTVVQVGACNGRIDNDHLHEVIRRGGPVDAHLIEAVDWLFDQLIEEMAPYAETVSCHCIALGGRDEHRPFFSVTPRFGHDFPESPEWKRFQIGSLTDEHLKLHVPEEYITTELMRVWSPRTWMDRTGIDPEALDLLMVDAEGFDGEIVDAFLDVSRPEMIVFEHDVMPAENRVGLLERLDDCGYVVKEFGCDVVAHRAR